MISSNRVRVLALAALVVAAGVVAGRGMRGRLTDAGAGEGAGEPEVEVDGRTTDLGTVFESPRHRWATRLTNRGASPARVSAIGGSCSCVAVEPTEVVLGPGETCEVKVLIDLTPRAKQTGRRPLSLTFGAQVTDEAGANPRPLRWTLSGTVVPVVSVRPPSIAYDAPLVANRAGDPKHVRVTPAVAIDRVHVKSAPPGWDVRVGGAGEDFEVSATPRGLHPGAFAESIVLGVSGPDGQAYPDVKIPVTGRVVDEIYPNPPAAVLGFVPVGEEGEVSVSLVAHDREPFEVTAVRSADGVRAVREPSRDGVAKLVLRRRVTAPGPGNETVRVEVVCRGATRDIPVPCEWVGIVREPHDTGKVRRGPTAGDAADSRVEQ